MPYSGYFATAVARYGTLNVRLAGFEPTTSSSQMRRATKLRYNRLATLPADNRQGCRSPVERGAGPQAIKQPQRERTGGVVPAGHAAS